MPRKGFRVFYFLLWIGSLAGPLGLAGAALQKKPVLLGIDVLEARGFDVLRGQQVGLITNQTSLDTNGKSTVEILSKAPNVKLVALFSPEHGFRGTVVHGQRVDDTFDRHTHLPIYSLYGSVQRPTPEMLNAIDVLVFDIQDVGVRYYTYLATMGMAMEEAGRRGITFMVLDRPNPISGSVVEGPMADPKVRHLTSYYSVPVRHGFTAGELAQWYNETARLNVNLKVIPMIGWNRGMFWLDTGLPFTPPSPNIRTPDTALLYSGIGMFEATNLSVGRGTALPFQVIGAPWIKGKNFLRRLRALQLPGLKFKKAIFVPETDLYVGLPCEGVRIVVSDPAAVRPVDLFVEIACLLRELYPNDFQLRWPEVARMTGTDEFHKLYESHQPAGLIKSHFRQSAAQFLASREKYLLY